MVVKRNGNYVRTPVQKRMGMVKAFTNPKDFPSLTAVANHFKVSRNTVKKLLEDLVLTGQISSKNHLLSRTRADVVSVRLKKVQRNKNIIDFVLKEAKAGRQVSVNLLQNKFGGEKKTINEILKKLEEKFAKTKTPIIRRSKSSQPKRK